MFQRREFRPDHIRPRPVAFAFPSDIPKHWAGGSPVRTHLMNSLHLFLPAFEKLIVRNVKDGILPEVRDPRLRAQARGLVAQEALHSGAHASFVRNLREQGYAVDRFLRFTEGAFEAMEARLGPRGVLAAVASFEHYTDLLVDLLFETDFLDGCDPRLAELLAWHAAEEVEHHAVPFELLLAVRGSYTLRQVGNVLGLAIIAFFMAAGAGLLLWQDRAWSRVRTWRELVQFGFTKYGIVGKAARLFVRYARPGYLPEIDARAPAARRVLEATAP